MSVFTIHYTPPATNMSLKHVVVNTMPMPVSSDHPAIFTAHFHHHHTFVKEHMFEKRLTPSDVGKLNRLVIPKQYAEKYLPFISAGSLLMSFVDESGKPWKFRYSYWNSSQSYVLTKGWSRFIKEKKLESGDVVFFQRQVVDGRSTSIMFLGWRRKINDGTSISLEKRHPTEIKRNVKFKTVRLFGVNLECRTPDPEDEELIAEMELPTPHHG